MSAPGLRQIPGGRAPQPERELTMARELERSLVSALLHAPEKLEEVLGLVNPERLLDIRLRPVLAAMRALASRSKAADNLELLAAELTDMRKLDEAGGAEFLAELSDLEATGAHALDLARRVRFDSLERERRLLYERASRGEDVHAALAEAQHELAAEWPAPTPLMGIEVPDFPIEALPFWLRDFVKAEAEATQTPLDLSGMLVLSALSAALARKARVRVKNGHVEPLNLYAAVALDPGNLKSPVFSHVTAPLYEHEKKAVSLARETIATAETRLEVLRERQKKAARDAAVRGESSTDKVEELALAVVRAEDSLPRRPRFVTDDVTPEKLAALMAEHGGRIALLSAEGGELFEIARGRYSGNARPNLGVYLRGWSGDPLVVDRQKASFAVDRPALTIGVTIQPAVLEALRDEGAFRERGLLGRFLYSVPRSRLGARGWRNAEAVPEAVGAEYHHYLGALLKLPPTDPERELCLSREAREAFEAFREELEPELGQDGRLAWMSDWAAKLSGQVLRIAGLLHAAEWADRADLFELEVEPETMGRAIALGHYLLDHAQAAFEAMHADPARDGALKVWRFVRGWSERQGGALIIPRRALWQGVKGGRFARDADLDAPLRLLAENDHIAEEPQPARRRSPGRPQRLYRLNPRALALS